MNQDLKMLEKPFENIALAFSGGGFRAASFALGVLSYLDELKMENGKPMLEHVSYISSASGGTIAAAAYTRAKAKGMDFGTFYKDMLEFLTGEKLLAVALSILNDDKKWTQTTKSRNIINAFAIAYDEMLFDQKTMAHLRSEGSHLEEVCFNTTEFYRGLLFRQAVKVKDDALGHLDKGFLFGNYIVNLDNTTSDALKIADCVAASSCFPAGFEPIIFPTDFGPNKLLDGLAVKEQEVSLDELLFLYVDKTVETVKNSDLPKDPNLIIEALEKEPLCRDLKIGLMDGGITDNQGIESLIRANQRRIDKETAFQPFDFMLINDVGSHYMDPYKLPRQKRLSGFQRMITVKSIFVVCAVLFALGISATAYALWLPSVFWSKLLLLVSVPVLFVSGLTTGILLAIRNLVMGNVRTESGFDLSKSFSREVLQSLFMYFKSTPILVLLSIVRQRVSSVLMLNSDVFLKRVRQLLYRQFFDDAKAKFKIKANHVYDLCFTNDLNFQRNGIEGHKPGLKLQIVAETAYNIGTTLWFDSASRSKVDSMACLVACGQATTCYNILEYIVRLRNSPVFEALDPEYQTRVERIHEKVVEDYSRFNADPFYMYNTMGDVYNIDKFKPVSADELEHPKQFEKLRVH